MVAPSSSSGVHGRAHNSMREELSNRRPSRATFGEAREADIRFVSAFLRSQIRNELIGDSSRVSTDFGSRLSVPIIIMWPRPYQLSISRPSSSKNSMPISGMSGRPAPGQRFLARGWFHPGRFDTQGQSGYRSRLDLVVTGDHDGRTFRMPAQGQQFPPVVGRSPHAATFREPVAQIVISHGSPEIWSGRCQQVLLAGSRVRCQIAGAQVEA